MIHYPTCQSRQEGGMAMKWCEYYKELMLNDGNVGQLLAAIATGDGWPAKFVTCEMLDNEGQLIDEKLTDEPEIHLIIESIVSDPKFATFTMVVKTSGELPAGVQHGTYR